MTEYTYEKKKKLASRIRKIHNISHLKNIRDIIKKCNPDMQFVQNSNGILLLFNSLENNTYKELDNYINNANIIKN